MLFLLLTIPVKRWKALGDDQSWKHKISKRMKIFWWEENENSTRCTGDINLQGEWGSFSDCELGMSQWLQSKVMRLLLYCIYLQLLACQHKLWGGEKVFLLLSSRRETRISDLADPLLSNYFQSLSSGQKNKHSLYPKCCRKSPSLKWVEALIKLETRTIKSWGKILSECSSRENE